MGGVVASGAIATLGGFSRPAPRAAAGPEVTAPDTLKDPVELAAIPDRAARSHALFREASRVIQSPRCLNCHPRGDSPTQGEDRHPHYPTVVRGMGGFGVAGMECSTCHQGHNQQGIRVPGGPGWHLAPASMSWAGRTVGEICEQLKDPSRNGGRTLAQVVEHGGGDPLVGWAWSPGADRRPAPGTQKQFGALLAEWVATGAECPAPGQQEDRP
jgi:hypothetical protein